MPRTSFAVAAMVASLAAARTYAETVDRRPAFEVVVDNHAPDAAPEMAAARARAGFLFGEAGIRVTWPTHVDDPAVVPGREPIVLVVLDRPEGNHLFTGDIRRLGFAVPPASRVYVHYPRVSELARYHGAQPGWFLGVVLAHVLLPRTGHAAEGIMSASLTPDPKRPPAFSRGESRQLRRRLGEETLLGTQLKKGAPEGAPFRCQSWLPVFRPASASVSYL